MEQERLLDYLNHGEIAPWVENYTIIKITGEISVTATELPHRMIIKTPSDMIYIEGYGYVSKKKLGIT